MSDNSSDSKKETNVLAASWSVVDFTKAREDVSKHFESAVASGENPLSVQALHKFVSAVPADALTTAGPGGVLSQLQSRERAKYKHDFDILKRLSELMDCLAPLYVRVGAKDAASGQTAANVGGETEDKTDAKSLPLFATGLVEVTRVLTAAQSLIGAGGVQP